MPIADTGHQALRSQQLLLATLIPRKSLYETVVVHHIKDGYHVSQLEIERRSPKNGITFERIYL